MPRRALSIGFVLIGVFVRGEGLALSHAPRPKLALDPDGASPDREADAYAGAKDVESSFLACDLQQRSPELRDRIRADDAVEPALVVGDDACAVREELQAALGRYSLARPSAGSGTNRR